MNFDNCYHTIHRQTVLSLPKNEYDLISLHFGETGVVDIKNIIVIETLNNNKKLLYLVHFDAEPMDQRMIVDTVLSYTKNLKQKDIYDEVRTLFLTSDSSWNHIREFLSDYNNYTVSKKSKAICGIWYYFFHGFVALDWFREYKFHNIDTIINNKKFDYNYITMNRLVDGARNYRLCLMSRLEERGLTDKALVSYSPYTNDNSLPPDELDRVLTYCTTAKRFDLQGDIIPNDSMHINVDAHLRSFLHVVTETCYYQDFNHLTEKIFKPIVMMQPFVLASTKGGLKYLKSYGFKTFSKWIDESYDDIEDPYRRLDAITEEIEKICALTKDEQRVMYNEMLPILMHNRNHFYGDFYNVLHKEMWDNFSSVLSQT